MSNIVSPDLVSDGAELIESALSDTATVARTSASLPCYVEPSTRPAHMPYLPAPIRFLIWTITFKEGSDVDEGDQMDIAGKGKYWVHERLSPGTYEPALMVDALLSRKNDGSTVLPFNVLAKLTASGKPRLKIQSMPAYIYPKSGDLTVENRGQLLWDWAIVFDPDLRYLDTNNEPVARLGNGDQISFSWNGLTRSMVLHEPQIVETPIPAAIADMVEAGGGH